jgi:hypothetical protein
MKYLVQGFPEEISAELHPPELDEMIRAPLFMRAPLESVLEHGTEWQKRLLDATPFRHDKKYAMVSCGVHIQAPGYRTLAMGGGGVDRPHQDWHIDGERPDDHLQEEERVFLLQTPCSSLTQFNETAFELDAPESVVEDRGRLTAYICERAVQLGLRGRSVAPNRIVTFTNHLHRPVVAREAEYRFFWRARESDQVEPSPAPGIGKVVQAWDVAARAPVPQIIHDQDEVLINMPDVERGRALDDDSFNEVF